MTHTLKPMLIALAGSLAMARGHATTLAIDVEIPAPETGQYHRPYIAVWLENADRSVVRDLAVWYEQNKANGEGTKWLKDLRRWWRVSGRNQSATTDGVSGATRASGHHTLSLVETDPRLATLPPGHYTLAVEAAREKGGHELVRLDLPWPASNYQATASGHHELGQIQLHVTP
jgi:hypothetical protein